MKIGYFDTAEFESRDGQPSPFKYVVHIGLIDKLNEIREEFGAEILVNSGYRSPEHNRKVGGVWDSQHVQGLAADIRPRKLEDLKRLAEICDRLNPNGGVGFYETFVHVDVRGLRARWGMRP